MSSATKQKSSAGKNVLIFFIVFIILEMLIVVGVGRVFKNKNVTPSIAGYSLYIMNGDGMGDRVPDGALVITSNMTPSTDKIGEAVVCENVPDIGTSVFWLYDITSTDDNNGVVYTVYQEKDPAKLYEQIGITCEEMKDPDTRKLIFVNEELKLRFFLAKGPDVPTYVEYGAADIGVVGKDTILEEGRNIYEVLDLGFGKCRMCICGPESARELLQHHEQIRVATKYPHIAKDYFYNKKHQTVEIIKLNGSIELAPIVGLSEVICDIVETGTTLKENGLTVLEEVCPLSARVVVNQVSMKMDNERITKLISDLKTVIK